MKRYKLLILFLGLVVVGMAIRYILGEDSALWTFWNVLDVASAVALAVLAALAYREMIRDEDEVRLFFNVNGNKVDTHLSLLRKDCTRSEIIGVLGMMQRRTKERFIYDARHLPDLLKEINRVQKGSRKALYIPLTPEEFDQFVLNEKR